MKAVSVLKTVLAVLTALLAGLIGLSLFFSDLGPGETWTERLAIAGLLFFGVGLLLGLFHQRAWALSGLTAWGALFLGLVGLLTAPSKGLATTEWLETLGLLLLPLGLALAGGYLGALVARRFPPPRSYRRR